MPAFRQEGAWNGYILLTIWYTSLYAPDFLSYHNISILLLVFSNVNTDPQISQRHFHNKR